MCEGFHKDSGARCRSDVPWKGLLRDRVWYDDGESGMARDLAELAEGTYVWWCSEPTICLWQHHWMDGDRDGVDCVIQNVTEAYPAAITLTNGDHYSQSSNSHTTQNHMLPRKNPHCSYKWDTTPLLSPPLTRRPTYLTLKSDYYDCKKHEKKPMLHMNSHDRKWWNKSHGFKLFREGDKVWLESRYCTSNSAMKARN